MSELDESPNVETAGSAGDSGAWRGPEVGESGPAGVAEWAAGATDNVIRDAGEVANKAEAVGSEGLTEVGKLAGEAASAGTEGLQKAGDIAGTVAADAGQALGEAGNIASAAEADGAKVLEDVGAAAGKLESEVVGDMDRAMAQVDAAWDAGQPQGLDMVQASDTGAGDNFLSVGWDAGVSAETGESGPAGPVEQFAESWDNVLTGGGWNTGAPLETGESGPAAESWETAVEVVGESLEVAAAEGAAEAMEESSEEWRDR